MKPLIQLSRMWGSIAILSLIYSLWGSFHYFPSTWSAWVPYAVHTDIVSTVLRGLLFVSIYNTIASFINAVGHALNTRYRSNKVLRRILALKRPLKVMGFLIISYQAILAWNIDPHWQKIVYQYTRVMITGTIGWCLFELIQTGEVLFLQYLPSHSRDSIDIRRRYTHLAIIKRILSLLLVVITTAVMLMTFERVQAAGTAILASAGVFTTIAAFSARGLLESIFKGLQLIIAQPVRLEDTVTLNGETGTVSSITLHHVVITLSDRSQLIVPTGDFLDKTFKNWTHSSDDLIGNVLFYVKYNMPIDAIRKKFQEQLKMSQHWDEEVGEVDVSHVKNNLVELKFIMSAKSGKALAKLRNEILEGLLAYMQTNHPEKLP